VIHIIKLKRVTRDNYLQVIKLKVHREQFKFVAKNKDSLVEASVKKEYVPKAIYYNKILVGFLMFARNDSYNGYAIHRLMIDKKYQGLGYGKEALSKLIELFKKEKKYNDIYISLMGTNMVARKLYEELGFINTGDLTDNCEIILSMKI